VSSSFIAFSGLLELELLKLDMSRNSWQTHTNINLDKNRWSHRTDAATTHHGGMQTEGWDLPLASTLKETWSLERLIVLIQGQVSTELVLTCEY
jgi:hypothetical protein